jgi:hypothetical protein
MHGSRRDLHVHDDLILWRKQALEWLAGRGIQVVKASWAVVYNDRHTG